MTVHTSRLVLVSDIQYILGYTIQSLSNDDSCFFLNVICFVFFKIFQKTLNKHFFGLKKTCPCCTILGISWVYDDVE